MLLCLPVLPALCSVAVFIVVIVENNKKEACFGHQAPLDPDSTLYYLDLVCPGPLTWGGRFSPSQT